MAETIPAESPSVAQGPDASSSSRERTSEIPVEPTRAEPHDTGTLTPSDADSTLWGVKEILDHRGQGRAKYFLIDWEGDYTPTWEPKRELIRDQVMREEIQRYERRERARQHRQRRERTQ